MNGAESLVRAFADAGMDLCFANPGTSEMHLVAALDRVGGIRCVLGLHETIVTGAADGYARMAGKPALTLLHLGPGLGNGIANLHNARKAGTAVVNVVGEHASWHLEHDAPLTSDIEGLARPVSHWLRTARSATTLAADAAEALKAAAGGPAGRIATLIVPANAAWEEADGDGSTAAASARDADEAPSSAHGEGGAADGGDRFPVEAVAAVLRSDEPSCLVLGGDALSVDALEQAGRIAARTGAKLVAETFKARFARGAGRVTVPSIPYEVEQALELLAPFRHVVTVGAKPPVGFFAYPDTPSLLYPPEAALHALAAPGDDALAALRELAAAIGAADTATPLQEPSLPERPTDGPLTPEALGALLAARLPERAIVVDESITLARPLQRATAGAAAHEWLQVCGGSIGGGFPLATGAAVACPDRPVIALEADGSGMYSLQALWTQAREGLDVTTIILANRRYAILEHELDKVRAESGRIARDMMSLDHPALDWTALAAGMGVPAVRVDDVGGFDAALERGLGVEGPFLIEAVCG